MFFVSKQCMAAALVAMLGLVTAGANLVHAQGAPGVHQDNSGINGSLSREDLEKLGGTYKNDTSADVPKDSILARAKAKAQSQPLLLSLRISCEVSDAKLVVVGTRRLKSASREVETRVYEVACSDGMGYLLQTAGKDTPIAISCLSAEEARAADALKGKESGLFCKLPGNRDVYAMLANLIKAGSGAQCEVDKVQLFGRSEATHSEYSEVACKEGNGFLLRIAQPGNDAKTLVMTCAEAGKQSIKCRLTDPGPVEAEVTTQTFKEALARNGVSCTIGQFRFVGQEEHLKRYVVEYTCAERGNTVVAFIPLTGNSNPYESLDCDSAFSRHDVVCQLNSK